MTLCDRGCRGIHFTSSLEVYAAQTATEQFVSKATRVVRACLQEQKSGTDFSNNLSIMKPKDFYETGRRQCLDCSPHRSSDQLLSVAALLKRSGCTGGCRYQLELNAFGLESFLGLAEPNEYVCQPLFREKLRNSSGFKGASRMDRRYQLDS